MLKLVEENETNLWFSAGQEHFVFCPSEDSLIESGLSTTCPKSTFFSDDALNPLNTALT